MEQRQLRELEAMCIQEAPPPCTTACPLHVDVRAMILEVRRGDFPAALKTLKKTLPFPGIVGRLCQAPCQEACRRNEAGDSIAISALEWAVAEQGGDTGRVGILPARPGRVAIVGGGPCGLMAAFDLRKKGLPVTLVDAGDRLGGRLRDVPESKLPRRLIHDELSVLDAMGVQVLLNTPLLGDGLPALQGEYAAVLLAVGAGTLDSFGLALDEGGKILVDAVTYATDREGVFAGGSLLHLPGTRSLIDAMADGRRAATSIDRYLQKASLTAARLYEGPYPSQLFTNTQGIAPLRRVPMTDPVDGYNREEAVQEAERCFPCNCLECVKVCEYLRHYRNYPKKYLREIYNNLSIVAGTRHANQFINSCSLCGLCGQVCPTNLDMGTVCRGARRTMVAQGRMPPSAHDFALRDMLFSNGEGCSLARHAPGTTASDYVFFPGCQLCASAPDHVEQVYAHLQDRLSSRTGLMMGCCGAPAEWAGRDDLLYKTIGEFRVKHGHLGSPPVIVACSTCFKVFKEHLPDVRTISLWDMLEKHGLPAEVGSLSGLGALAIHDPCTTRNQSGMNESVRRILERLGCEIEELPLSREKTECCSFGGVMWLANRDLAHDVIERRISSSAADFVTYCAVCRDFFAAHGKRTLHLLDLLFDQDPGARAARPTPGWSQRHENRVRLKRRFLRDVWREEMPARPTYEEIELVISAAVLSQMESRLILVEDVQQVIEHAERTGARFQNRSSGHLLAGHRPGKVTYWVEYSPDAGNGLEERRRFVVHNAYSHRMEVGEGVQ